MKPLKTRRSLAEDAAERIQEEILKGGFHQGERLVEARIAEQLGISRGPVREAFKLLRAEGLIEEEPRRGTFVVSLSSEDVREIYDLRAALESRAVELIAAAHRESDLRELHRVSARLEEAAAKNDVEGVAQADLAFHEGICRLTGNRRLHAVFMRNVPALRALIRLDEYIYQSPQRIVEQHKPLLEAIEAGDKTLAAARIEDHIEQARDLVCGYIDDLAVRS